MFCALGKCKYSIALQDTSSRLACDNQQQRNKPQQAAGFSLLTSPLTTQLAVSAVATCGGGVVFCLGAVSVRHNTPVLCGAKELVVIIGSKRGQRGGKAK